MGDGLKRVTGIALTLKSLVNVNEDDSERISSTTRIEGDGEGLFRSGLCSGIIHHGLYFDNLGTSSDIILQNEETDHGSAENIFKNTETIFRKTDVNSHRSESVLNAIMKNGYDAKNVTRDVGQPSERVGQSLRDVSYGSEEVAIGSRIALQSSSGTLLNLEEPLKSGHGLSKIPQSSGEGIHTLQKIDKDHSFDDASQNTDQDTGNWLPFFSSIPDDILVNIFCRLFEDPRHLARLACACTRFCKMIKIVCWKSRCEQTLPFLVSELVHPPFSEPPGGWASLQKLIVCCPGLWHAGVLLEHWDFGLDRELAWFDELNSSSNNSSSAKCHTAFGYKTFGGPGSDRHRVNCNTLVQCSSRSSGRLEYGKDTEEYVVDVNGCGILPQNHLKYGDTSRNAFCNDQNGVIHDFSKVPYLGYDGWGQDVVLESYGNYRSDNVKGRHRGSKRTDRKRDDAKQTGRHESGYHIVPSDVISGEKRKGEDTERDEKRSKKQQHACCHIASGSSSLSREQGNKLLANRFRTDCLYISDWPGCVHPGEKRKYKLFRGIFKNFKNSHVWRNLKDMHAKATNVGCAFCACKTTWDMVTTFCLKRSIEYHDDGEPVVRAYVCENGHVSGAWTDRPMYSL